MKWVRYDMVPINEAVSNNLNTVVPLVSRIVELDKNYLTNHGTTI